LTGGYRLPARYVIHTVGPVYHGRPEDARLLASCYRNSLLLAVAQGLQSIAFPAISCGIYGYPIDEASRIAVRTVQEFLASHALPETVLFVLFSPEFYDLYCELLRDAENR